MRVGERLGFGMALALVIVAAQIVTFDLVPVSNRKLWIDKFVAWSFYWVLGVLVQSVFVGFLYFLREDQEAKKAGRRISKMSIESREDMMENLAAIRAADEAANGDDVADFPCPPCQDEKKGEIKKNIVKQQAHIELEKKDSWFYTFSLRNFDCKYCVHIWIDKCLVELHVTA